MDAKSIINLGLSPLGAYNVSTITPPVTPLEKKCADQYPQWRDSRLTANRWVFARNYEVLTLGAPSPSMATAERPHAFALPNNCLRPIREKSAKWEQRGKHLYHNAATLTIEFIARVVEADFDPLFVDTLAAWITYRMCEYVTQSNIKKADAKSDYEDTIKVARAANALIIGNDEQIGEADDDDDWISARRGAGL